jgi:hypothetical protein
MTFDGELPKRARQTMKEAQPMLVVFFNLKDFVGVSLLPEGMSFTAACFVDNEIIPLSSWHAEQRGGTVRRKLYLDFDNSKCHTARHVQEQMVSHRWVGFPHTPCSPNVAIADFYLFGQLKQ